MCPSSSVAVGKSSSVKVSPDFTNVFPVPCSSFTPSPFSYVTTTASSGVGCVGSVGTSSFLLYTNSFWSTSSEEPSANVTVNVPGNVPFAFVVLFDLSVTVAPANKAASLPSASCTLSASAAPFFQKSASSVSPTHAARSTPFSPPASVIVSAVVFFVALAVNLKYPCLLRKAGDDSVTILSSGLHVTGPLYPSLNVISFSCGKSLSSNFVSGLTYVFPVVVILATPVAAKNLTSIFLSGRSSSFGASGSVLLGSTVTMCSHTYSH